MSRNSSGTYTLPQAAFIPNTTISSSAVNSNFSDIATALTQSLATTGVSAMTAPLPATAGSASAPGYTFSTDAATGIYLSGSHQLNFSSNGTQIANVNSSGLQLNAGNFLDNSGNKLGGVPVGTVIDYAGATAPALWLLCYGQAISRTTYASLFTAIGTVWGTGDGFTTFNVPDLRGRAVFGKDNMGGVAALNISVGGLNFDGTVLGGTGGAQNQTLTISQLPAAPPSGSTISGSQTITGLNTGSVSQNQAGGGVAGPSNTNDSRTINGSNFSFTGNLGLGGAHTILSPAAICNKIIFAGV